MLTGLINPEILTPGIVTLAEGGFVRDFFFGAKSFTSRSGESDSLFLIIFWVCVAFFVVLMWLMVHWSIKYRRKSGEPLVRSASHNTALEITWTIAPLFLLAYFFFEGFRGYMMYAVAPAGAIQMNLVGQKWDWNIIYPNGASSTERADIGDGKPIPVFYMPEHTAVKLRMQSRDVIHAFWVPDFRNKFDVMPNRYTMYWFQTDDAAGNAFPSTSKFAGQPYRDHWVFCAEYCGDQHSQMAAIIRVVPQSVFDVWVEDQNGAGLSPPERGRLIAQGKGGCVACHSSDGSRIIGPTWKGLWGTTVKFADGTSGVADENYIRESILNPLAKIHEGYQPQMNSYQGILRDDEILFLIEYMKTLGNAPPADAAPAPVEGEKK